MAEIRADILRAVRVITAAYIRTRESITREETLAFIRDLIRELHGEVQGADIIKAKAIKILFADEEVKK